jgi:hypothetical protein
MITMPGATGRLAEGRGKEGDMICLANKKDY